MVMKTIDLLKTILILFFVCLLGGEIAFADWVGPVEVVSGKWGKGHGEFGFASTSEDWFPRFFNVNNKDEIFIFDEINKAIHKFNNKGDLLDNNLETGSFLIHPNGNILITGKTTNRFFYNESGDLVSTVDIKHEDPFVGENGYWFIETIYKNNKYSIKYHLYSLKGDYIGNFSKETIKSLPDKIKRHNNDTLIVEYNDGIVYEFKVDNVQKISDIYFRDKYKSFYILETHLKPYWKDYTVYQKNICSNDIRKLAMPEGNVHLQTVKLQYGQPIVSNNGDIYCWKRTPDTYSILKWTWVESPDSPLNLKAITSNEAVSLTWEPSQEDSENIIGYEILSSTDPCGQFNEVGKTKKSILNYIDKDIKQGETYYYRVRAIKKDGYSGYSNKAVGEL